jgi:hypothetical protein
MNPVRSAARALLPDGARAFMRHVMDVVNTEYHYRFKRSEIRAHLETLRRIPRGLHVEGTNICNAECVFCAYPQMERKKTVMPMEDFRRIVLEYLAMGGRHVSLTPIVGDPFVDKHVFERLDFLMNEPRVAAVEGRLRGAHDRVPGQEVPGRVAHHGELRHEQEIGPFLPCPPPGRADPVGVARDVPGRRVDLGDRDAQGSGSRGVRWGPCPEV